MQPCFFNHSTSRSLAQHTSPLSTLHCSITCVCALHSAFALCNNAQQQKNPWAYHQKQEKVKKPMSIAANANKVCKSIKKTMSIPSKTRKDQKTSEHSSKSEQGVQKHQKNNEHTIKNKKRSKNPWAWQQMRTRCALLVNLGFWIYRFSNVRFSRFDIFKHSFGKYVGEISRDK